MDPLFRVEVTTASENPNQSVWRALHQDYSEGFVADEKVPEERTAGAICIKRLLSGERGHMGPFEHTLIVFNVGWFPHSVMQQARTHRVACSFDVQSGRYTGQRILDVLTGKRDIEEVFYLRQVGGYSDRQGKKYHYTLEQRKQDLFECRRAAAIYADKINAGYAEEHARGMIPFDIRQHFIVSFNARSLMHFLDLRSKADAQQEIRWLCQLMMERFEVWMPELAEWYKANRYGKARLAP